MRDFSARYCSEPCTIPLEYSCMWSEAIQGYCKLYQHYDQVVTKRKKIWKLAQPKHKKLKYHQECKCPRNTKCQIEIIDKTDRAESTRTEQLAFPKLRQLTHLKSHPSFSSFNNNRKSGVNRLIRKGLLSVYSRLQNVTPEEKPPQAKIWSAESKTKLMKRLKSLALPKKPPIDRRRINNKSKNVETPKMSRIRKLSKPRVHKEMPPNEWVLTDALKQYKATERLINMSQPKKIEQVYVDEDTFRKRQNALNYKASRRIMALAEPAGNRVKVEISIENPFQTNIKALKAVASKRVTELATPKGYSDMHTRTDAFKVSRNALRAKATPRLNELAEPKKR